MKLKSRGLVQNKTAKLSISAKVFTTDAIWIDTNTGGDENATFKKLKNNKCFDVHSIAIFVIGVCSGGKSRYSPGG